MATAHALDEHHADMSEHCATPETDRAPTPPRCPADMPMGCASMVSCAAPAALATSVVTLEMESPTPARRPQAPLTRLHSRVAPPDVPPPRA